jgi:hypothetical protein
MELRKENLQMLRVKSRAASQVTFDVDYNVPDARQDVGRMIQNKGQISMDEVRLNDGKAFLKGVLTVDLLYVGDEEGRVYSLTAKLPFQETMNLEGIAGGDKMCLKWEMEDLSLHLIHSRKLNIKALVTFYAVVDETTGIRLPVALDEESISTKKKNMRLMSLCVHKKDTMRIRDEILLASNKPNIAELLWYTMEVRGLDLRPEENRIGAKGELFIFALYAGDDEENPLQWTEYSMPFNSEVECSGCKEELIPQIETSIIHQSIEVKPDADGEERILAADMVIELDMKMYQEEEHEVILDVYTPLKECVLHGKTETLDSLLVRNFSRCRISERIELKETQGRILQLCHSQGKVKIDQTTVVENGIQVEGIVRLKVLYILGNDDMPFYSMEAMVPFTHVVEARDITQECSYHLQAELEQLSTTMADSNEIEVKAVVGLNVLVVRKQQMQIIEEVEEKPLDMQKIESMPGILVYMVKPKDTLWDIARRYYTTVEEIQALNELPDEEIHCGQPLLLVKKVGC